NKNDLAPGGEYCWCRRGLLVPCLMFEVIRSKVLTEQVMVFQVKLQTSNRKLQTFFGKIFDYNNL
ncbi:MAG: hypothetical protein ACXWWA_15195, partial [Chitinophagaceae bacterium]